MQVTPADRQWLNDVADVFQKARQIAIDIANGVFNENDPAPYTILDRVMEEARKLRDFLIRNK